MMRRRMIDFRVEALYNGIFLIGEINNWEDL